MQTLKISEDELSFSFSRSSGPGGQNVNKVNSKVTLIWDYLNSKSISSAVKSRFEKKYQGFITKERMVKLTSQRYRNQPQNILDCKEKLLSMIEKVAKPEKRRVDTKPTKGSIERRIKAKKGKSDIKKTRKKVKY